MNEKMDNIEQMATNMDFEFKETYWDEMAAILDANASKKAMLWLFFTSACFGVFIALSTLVYFTNNHTASYYKTLPQNQLANTSQNHNASIGITDNPEKNNTILTMSDKTRQERSETNTNDATLTVAKNNSSQIENQSNDTPSATHTRNTSSKMNKLNHNIDSQEKIAISSSEKQKINLHNTNIAGVNPMKIAEINSISSASAPLIQSVDILNYRPKLKHALLVELGVGYGANSFSRNKFGGEKIHLGVVYQLQKFNWGFKTGAHVSWNAVSGLNYLERQKIYGFSSKYVSSQLNYRAIVNLNIPLEATYTFRRNTFGLGAQLNVLMATTSKIRNWTDNSLSSVFEWNYSNNLRPVSVAIVADYTYQLSNRWRLGAAFSYMLTPVASNNNQVFRNKQFKLFSGQIFVQYDLKLFK